MCASSNSVTLKLISRPPARRPAFRVPIRHANLPDRQFCWTGCVWKHPFIYITSDAGVGPGSGFVGVWSSALRLYAASVRSYQHTLRITTQKSERLLVISQFVTQLSSLSAFTDAASLINAILTVAWRISLPWHSFALCGPFRVSLWERSWVSL